MESIRLTISSGNEEWTIDYDGAATLAIGRSQEAGIVLADERASRAHCEIRPGEEPGRFQLVDLASRNGTHLNGQPVESAPLALGDVIRVGSTLITFGEQGQGTRTGLEDLAEPAPPEPVAARPVVAFRPRLLRPPARLGAGAVVAGIAALVTLGVGMGVWLMRPGPPAPGGVAAAPQEAASSAPPAEQPS